MNWKPIGTAPKDRRILLYFPGTHVMFVVGRWDENQYATKPRPYWTCDTERSLGTRWVRSNQPTHWCEPTEPTE